MTKLSFILARGSWKFWIVFGAAFTVWVFITMMKNKKRSCIQGLFHLNVYIATYLCRFRGLITTASTVWGLVWENLTIAHA